MARPGSDRGAGSGSSRSLPNGVPQTTQDMASIGFSLWHVGQSHTTPRSEGRIGRPLPRAGAGDGPTGRPGGDPGGGGTSPPSGPGGISGASTAGVRGSGGAE